jgi:hypothetical protein
VVALNQTAYSSFIRCPRCAWEAFSQEPPRNDNPDLERLRETFLMHVEMRHDLSPEEALLLMPAWLYQGPIKDL